MKHTKRVFFYYLMDYALSGNVTEKSPDYGGRAYCSSLLWHISAAAAGALKF